MTIDPKEEVRCHWEQEACGTRYAQSASRKEALCEMEAARYRLEPYIPGFADFQAFTGKKVLEIGVGAGVDFSQWVKAGADATGVDLTTTGIDLTRERLNLKGVNPDCYRLMQADAESLPFAAHEFDLVYSWGVLHHSPDTERAFQEAYRVLAPGGKLKAMVYHLHSWGAWGMWTLHGFLKGKPYVSVRQSVFENLESPGTKVYSLGEAAALLRRAGFDQVKLSTKLGSGDLLLGKPSQRYRKPLHRLIWNLYPRWFVRLTGDRLGLYLLIEATKPKTAQHCAA